MENLKLSFKKATRTVDIPEKILKANINVYLKGLTIWINVCLEKSFIPWWIKINRCVYFFKKWRKVIIRKTIDLLVPYPTCQKLLCTSSASGYGSWLYVLGLGLSSGLGSWVQILGSSSWTGARELALCPGSGSWVLLQLAESYFLLVHQFFFIWLSVRHYITDSLNYNTLL